MKIFVFLILLLQINLWGQIDELPEVYRKLIIYQQKFNDKVENTRVFSSIHQNDLNPIYWPERQPVFALDVVAIPKSELVVIDTAGGKNEQGLSVFINGVQHLLFFIHPESRDLYQSERSRYLAQAPFLSTPLASHRSMIAWPADNPTRPIYIKLSLNKTIGESLRILTKGQIQRAATISFLLKTMDLKALATRGIHFVDEPFHVYLKSSKTGYSKRSDLVLHEGGELMPMFTLYSRAQGRTPLITKMVTEMISSGQQSAKEFIREKIMKPMISHMVELAFTEGLIGDPHEQNVMVRVKNGQITKDFYYLDLGGFDINQSLRERAHKNMSFVPKDFDPKYLKFERADMIEKSTSYLLNSNFYALQKAVSPTYPEITPEWVRAQFMNHLSSEVFLRTGIMARTPDSMKAAITKFIRAPQSLSRSPTARTSALRCESVFW